MEGVLCIPENRPQRRPDLICAECGRMFRPRHVADGVEELCDACFDAHAHFLPRRPQ
jgi:hypothetical protein